MSAKKKKKQRNIFAGMFKSVGPSTSQLFKGTLGGFTDFYGPVLGRKRKK